MAEDAGRKADALVNCVIFAEVSIEQVIGGAERVLRSQAVSLHQLGHTVTLIARAPTKGAEPHVIVEGITEMRYPVSDSTPLSFVTSSIAGSIRLFDYCLQAGPVDVVIIHQSLAGLGPVLMRRGKCRQWVYHCDSLAHEEYLTRTTTTSLLKRPLIRANAWIRRTVERTVIRRCRPVVVMSRFMLDRVRSFHGIPESAMSIVQGCVDVARFKPAENRREIRASLGMPDSGAILFTVRNLVARMGLENLIDAMAQLRGMAGDAHLFIGGQGPLRQALLDRIESHDLQDQIHLTGFIAEDLLPRYYQAADCVVMPTRQLEGFGLVTVEAMACGTPVLGTPVGAIPEVLAQVDPRLVTSDCDSNAIAQGLRWVLETIKGNPSEWGRLGHRCCELVNNEYTQERVCQHLLHAMGRS